MTAFGLDLAIYSHTIIIPKFRIHQIGGRIQEFRQQIVFGHKCLTSQAKTVSHQVAPLRCDVDVLLSIDSVRESWEFLNIQLARNKVASTNTQYKWLWARYKSHKQYANGKQAAAKK